MADNQPSVEVHVLQGERTEDCSGLLKWHAYWPILMRMHHPARLASWLLVLLVLFLGLAPGCSESSPLPPAPGPNRSPRYDLSVRFVPPAGFQGTLRTLVDGDVVELAPPYEITMTRNAEHATLVAAVGDNLRIPLCALTDAASAPATGTLIVDARTTAHALALIAPPVWDPGIDRNLLRRSFIDHAVWVNMFAAYLEQHLGDPDLVDTPEFAQAYFNAVDEIASLRMQARLGPEPFQWRSAHLGEAQAALTSAETSYKRWSKLYLDIPHLDSGGLLLSGTDWLVQPHVQWNEGITVENVYAALTFTPTFVATLSQVDLTEDAFAAIAFDRGDASSDANGNVVPIHEIPGGRRGFKVIEPTTILDLVDIKARFEQAVVSVFNRYPDTAPEDAYALTPDNADLTVPDRAGAYVVRAYYGGQLPVSYPNPADYPNGRKLAASATAIQIGLSVIDGLAMVGWFDAKDFEHLGDFAKNAAAYEPLVEKLTTDIESNSLTGPLTEAFLYAAIESFSAELVGLAVDSAGEQFAQVLLGQLNGIGKLAHGGKMVGRTSQMMQSPPLESFGVLLGKGRTVVGPGDHCLAGNVCSLGLDCTDLAAPGIANERSVCATPCAVDTDCDPDGCCRPFNAGAYCTSACQDTLPIAKTWSLGFLVNGPMLENRVFIEDDVSVAEARIEIADASDTVLEVEPVGLLCKDAERLNRCGAVHDVTVDTTLLPDGEYRMRIYAADWIHPIDPAKPALEVPFTLPFVPVALCGDGIVEPGEACDDGKFSDPCGPYCAKCNDGQCSPLEPAMTCAASDCGSGGSGGGGGSGGAGGGSPTGHVIQIATGYNHTCALLDTGTVRCWGSGGPVLGYGHNNNIGDDEPPASAGDINIGGNVVQVAAHNDYNCVLLDTGAVRCWGSAGVGQLGYGNTIAVGDDEPPASAGSVNLGGNIIQLGVGSISSHTCGVLDTGALRCWGSAYTWQLGYGNTNTIGDNETPASAGNVDVGGNVVQTAEGREHTCALLDTGAVRCWGYGLWGRLGYGNTNTVGDNETPASAGNVNVGGAVVQIAAGQLRTCALLATGTVRCWGYGVDGNLGYGNTNIIGDDETPASAGDINVGGTVVQLAMGWSHTCALLDTGAVRCWGNGLQGRLGYGNTNTIGDDEAPASAGDVNVGGKVVQLAAGESQTCALLDTGTVRCWGSAGVGQLGYGNTNNVGDDETPASAGDVPLL